MAEIRTEPVERQNLLRLGEAWILAITEGRLERLAELCEPDVTSHLQTPRRQFVFESAADLVAKVRQWFGACSDFHVEHSRVAMIGERLGIFYRLRLREDGTWRVVEQQVYATLSGGRLAELHLLCSGFQPTEAGQPAGSPATGGAARPAGAAHPTNADGLLVIQTGAAGSGSTCAVLTPAIKAKLREMQPGQVLEVRVDDPSAREDIETWCRLSGNALVSMSPSAAEDPGSGQELRFLVRKK